MIQGCQRIPQPETGRLALMTPQESLNHLIWSVEGYWIHYTCAQRPRECYEYTLGIYNAYSKQTRIFLNVQRNGHSSSVKYSIWCSWVKRGYLSQCNWNDGDWVGGGRTPVLKFVASRRYFLRTTKMEKSSLKKKQCKLYKVIFFLKWLFFLFTNEPWLILKITRSVGAELQFTVWPRPWCHSALSWVSSWLSAKLETLLYSSIPGTLTLAKQSAQQPCQSPVSPAVRASERTN